MKQITFCSPRRRCSRADRGIGALTLIGISLLLILFLLSVASSFFTRGVAGISAQVTCGDKALLIARAAISEALATIEAGVNTEGTRTFYFFRMPLTPDYNGLLYFNNEDRIRPEKVWEMVDEDLEVKFVNVEVWVPWQLRLYKFLPNEKYGRLHIRAEVGVEPGAGYKQVVRKVENIYEFKVAAPLPPTPFDSVTALAMSMKPAVEAMEQNYRDTQIRVEESIREQEEEIEDDTGEDCDIPRPYFESNPQDNWYKFFPVLRYPPFPLNTRSPQNQMTSQTSDMDNPLFTRASPFDIRNTVIHWPRDFMDNLQLSVFTVTQGGSVKVCEGTGGTTTFQPGDVITVRTQGSASASASFNGSSGACRVNSRQDTDSQGNTLNNIDITITGTPNAGYSNDELMISGGGVSNAVILFRGHQVRSLYENATEEMERYENAMQAALDDFAFTFTPVAENYVDQFTQELAIQLSWIGYVPRATHYFDSASKFTNYINVGGQWVLDGIYQVEAPLTINATYTGNGVIVTRGGQVTINRAKAGDAANDTLTVISTDNDITLTSGSTMDASLITPSGTVKGLESRSVNGNVIVAGYHRDCYDENAGGSVTYNPRLRRTESGTGNPHLDRYKCYINRQPVAVRISRKD